MGMGKYQSNLGGVVTRYFQSGATLLLIKLFRNEVSYRSPNMGLEEQFTQLCLGAAFPRLFVVSAASQAARHTRLLTDELCCALVNSIMKRFRNIFYIFTCLHGFVLVDFPVVTPPRANSSFHHILRPSTTNASLTV